MTITSRKVSKYNKARKNKVVDKINSIGDGLNEENRCNRKFLKRVQEDMSFFIKEKPLPRGPCPMQVYFHPDFYEEYSNDPAAETGRMEAIVETIQSSVELVQCEPATETALLAAHAKSHLEQVRRVGLYDIAALAAGGAIQAAQAGMDEPSFGLIRPPGHHASANSCWGFCYFNNIAVSLYHLRIKHRIERAFVLDFDLHTGDGNINILGKEPWVEILNPVSENREAYLEEVYAALQSSQADVIAVSAGFDHHVNDWGGLLYTTDYTTMGEWVRETALRNGGGCYGLLEGGYNHKVLGTNVLAFLQGLG